MLFSKRIRRFVANNENQNYVNGQNLTPLLRDYKSLLLSNNNNNETQNT